MQQTALAAQQPARSRSVAVRSRETCLSKRFAAGRLPGGQTDIPGHFYGSGLHVAHSEKY